jgi:hypothetical protein
MFDVFQSADEGSKIPMLRKVLYTLSNCSESGSLANKLRKRRFALFRRLLRSVPRPITILDVGGTEIFWENMGFDREKGIEILILNLDDIEVHHSNFRSMIGDARNMKQFKDKEFDVVFSNSVIQYVGANAYEDQKAMASEIKRVGKSYFVQTPNKYFPLEPHFLFPFFQFFPLKIQIFLLTHFNLPGRTKIPNAIEAKEKVNSIRLLTEKEVIELFPDGVIVKERLGFLAKSFIAYGGWNSVQY